LRLRLTIVTCLLLLSLAATSCGYRFGHGGLPTQYRSITVPYAEGDLDGSLTAEVIRQFSTAGAFEYRRCGGDLILNIKVLDFGDEDIDFRYYRNKEGKRTSETIPVETRLTVLVEVVVIDAATGVSVLGPARIEDYTDFDHDYYSTRDAVNVFSLGQLTDFDEAYDAAQRPLNQSLAKKIVNYVCDSW